jgi:transposase InsO family protein
MDACTRTIVGWSMREDLRAELVDALGIAVTRPRPNGRLIHHPDRGPQYASLLFPHAARPGPAREHRLRRRPLDNAICERASFPRSTRRSS